MALAVSKEIPDEYRQLIEKNVTLIVFNRCRWILPVAICLIFIFLIVESLFPLWTGISKIYFFLDLVGFINFSFLYLFLVKNKINNEDEVGKSQFIVQHATAGSIIIYCALVSAFDNGTFIGSSTFIVGLMFVSALMYIKPLRLLPMALAGILLHLITAFLMTGNIPADIYFDKAGLFLVVLLISLIVNRFNAQLMIKNIIFELDLEKKVKQRTKELAAQTSRAEKSDQMKTVFLANMSHEIRTPLNGILGFAELLHDDNLDSAQRKKYLDIVVSSGKNLLEILNGIIEVSRIESGECELYIENFSLNDVVSDVTESFSAHPKIQSGQLKLIHHDQDVEPVIIETDRLKLIQILSNLINNAIKYSNEGEINTGLKLLEDDRVALFVQDTGKGMSKDEIKLIFSRFLQLDMNPYTFSEGVGLGLTIVKGYVELLKGEIEVNSEPGVGTEFKLTFPLKTDTL